MTTEEHQELLCILRVLKGEITHYSFQGTRDQGLTNTGALITKLYYEFESENPAAIDVATQLELIHRIVDLAKKSLKIDPYKNLGHSLIRAFQMKFHQKRILGGIKTDPIYAKTCDYYTFFKIEPTTEPVHYKQRDPYDEKMINRFRL